MLVACISSQKKAIFGSYPVISLKNKGKAHALFFRNIQIMKVCGPWPFG